MTIICKNPLVQAENGERKMRDPQENEVQKPWYPSLRQLLHVLSSLEALPFFGQSLCYGYAYAKALIG
jgi:hypothetical protein